MPGLDGEMSAGRHWTTDELRELVQDTTIVGRDLDARAVRLPDALTGVGVPDPRTWGQQMTRMHPSELITVVDAWWRSVDSPGEVITCEIIHPVDGGWTDMELRFLNLLHQSDIGCILTFTRRLGPAKPPDEPDDEPATVAATFAIVQHLDELGTIQRSEGDVEEIFGEPASRLEGQFIVDRLHPEDRAAAVAMWLELIECPDATRTIHQRVVRPDDTCTWIQSIVMNRLEADGSVLATSYDISTMREQQQALEASERELRFLAQVVPVGVFRTDEADVVRFTNDHWIELLSPVDSANEVVARCHPDDRSRLRRVYDEVKEAGTMDIVRVRGVDGRHLEFRLQGAVGSGGVGVIGTVDDVTAAVHRASELQASAERDPLTGLANRRGLTRALDRAVTDGRHALVVFGDLDDFKQVNDEYGHAAGDEMLAGIGARLLDAVRPGDVVGRWGGDEFVIICLDVRDDADDEVVARLHGALAEPMRVGQREIRAHVSLGAVRPGPGEVSEAVLKRADTAMYEAKRARHRRSHG